MKFTILALLIAIFLISTANLLFHLGFIGNPPSEYKALDATQMDEIGFKKLAENNGIAIDADGKIKFPNEMRNQLLKFNILPFTINEIEKEGWRLVTVTADNHYIFRKSK